MILRWLATHLAHQVTQRRVQEAIVSVAKAAAEGARTQSPQAPPVAQRPPDAPCRLMFLFALGVESAGLVDQLHHRQTRKHRTHVEHIGRLQSIPVLIADTGVGQTAARQAVEKLLDSQQPEWVVSAGFAGALQPQLKCGHIVMVDEVADLGGRRLSTGLKLDKSSLEATPSLHVGRLLTVDRMVRTRDERRQLAETTAALACDMETLAMAEVCRERRRRFLSVRIISDSFEDELPAELEAFLDQKSLAGKLGVAAGTLWQSPSRVKDLWHLRDQALRASQHLAHFLTTMLPQLGG